MPETVVASAEANRSTTADYIFARASWSLGVSFRCQFVWQFDEALSAQAVEQLHAGLSIGPLNRSMARPRVIGARPSWRRAATAGGLVIDEGAVPRADRRQWSQEQLATAPLDVERGPTWRLSMAPVENGGTLLSLVWLHAVADGLGAINAIAAASTGGDLGCLPDDAANPPSLWDDVKDALGRLRAVLAGLVQVLVFLLLSAGKAQSALEKHPTARRPPAPGEHGVFQPTSTVLRFPRGEWSNAAAARGGTDNTLAVALTGRLAVATGCVLDTDTVPIDLSISERSLSSRDVRANMLVSATVPTRTADASASDLSEARQETKRALAQLQSKERQLLEAVLQIAYFAPTWLLRRRVVASPPPPCLLSNLGTLPPAVLRIGGLGPSVFAPRLEWFDVPEYVWRKLPPAMGVFCATADDAVFVGVQHSNPASPISAEQLDKIVIAESERFGVRPTQLW